MNKNKYISEDEKAMFEWDWEENNKLGFFPDKITQGSVSKQVIWRCSKCGKPYPMSPRSKIKLKFQCRQCGHNKNVSPIHNLTVHYPDLAKEWDFEKNYPIRPEDIAPKTNKIYFWLCSKGHSYSASPNNRIKPGKSRCNECYLSENNLAVKNPELAKQWHPTKNGNLIPEIVTFGCNDFAWWSCPICGHEWKAKINNRNNGRGCPKCNIGTQTSAPEMIIFHYLNKYFPDAIHRYKIEKKEIDVYIPSLNVGIEYDGDGHHQSEHSFKKDSKKNEFLSKKGITLIRIREAKCHAMDERFCQIYPIEQTSDYLTIIPILEDILSKLQNIQININVEDFIRNINEIKSNLHKKPFEDSLAAYILQKENDGFPLEAFWDYEENNRINLFPEKTTRGSRIKAYWICRNNNTHKFKKEIHRIAGGEGCSKCSGRNKTTEEWINEARAVHGNKYDYSKVNYTNSNAKIIIICKKHGEFRQRPLSHVSSGNGCPFCSGQGGFHVLETLAVKDPELAKEWDYDHEGNKGFAPNGVLVTDKNTYWWKCNKGKPHSYRAKISYRIERKSGCAVCHGKQVSWDTCLEYLRPDLLSEWHESNIIKPSKVTLKSEKMIMWKCPNPDHESYQMRVCERVNAKYGCQYCSGRKKSHHAFATQLKEKFPNIELLSKYIQTDIRIECKCNNCGQIWNPFPNNLLKTGCSKCKKNKNSG